MISLRLKHLSLLFLVVMIFCWNFQCPYEEIDKSPVIAWFCSLGISAIDLLKFIESRLKHVFNWFGFCYGDFLIGLRDQEFLNRIVLNLLLLSNDHLCWIASTWRLYHALFLLLVRVLLRGNRSDLSLCMGDSALKELNLLLFLRQLDWFWVLD